MARGDNTNDTLRKGEAAGEEEAPVAKPKHGFWLIMKLELWFAVALIAAAFIIGFLVTAMSTSFEAGQRLGEILF